ncbi:MAG: universal stress protein, partial [Gammaproteobacteria bacterium]|nr:universal stress protein [Gemmatimonadota bacterium]NIU77007.1 universal stress protein [Gammaproteobacteria bacterium]
NYSPTAWYGALAWIGTGIGIFLLYSRKRVREVEVREETRLLVEKRAAAERPYQVLVPLADPEHAAELARIGAYLARSRGGELLLTSVVTVPEQTPLDVGERYVTYQCEMLAEAARKVPEGMPVHRTVTIGHDVGKSICNIARQRHSDLVLVGWRGRRKRRFADLVLGSIIDRVVLDAPTDVCVAKVGGATERRHVVVPTAGGPHADAAADLAAGFLAHSDARVTLLTVADGARGEPAATRDRLLDELELGEASRRLDTATVEDGAVADRILEWAVEHGADTIVVGATEEGLLRQAVFGAIPERIGEGFDGTVLMVRKHLPIRSLLSG